MPEGYDVYSIIESVIFLLYLVFIFLSIQTWLLWRDIDKNKLKEKTFLDDSFFNKSIFYIFSLGMFFMLHEFIEGTDLPNAAIYFEFFEMLALSSLVSFAYVWYAVLRTCADKTSLLQELTYPIKENV